MIELSDNGDDAQFLRERERARRENLWLIAALQPGDPAAESPVNLLIAIEAGDETYPIGDAWQLSAVQVRDQVPRTALSERIFLIRDQDIPEPWRERFTQASVGSTRPEQGAYGHDWLKFLQLWEREMAHLDAHKQELSDD